MEFSQVAGFYVGRSAFVTGATGFVGKALVEKLLRSCPDVHRLYLLIRSKPNQDVRKRLDDLIQTEVFDNIRANQPELLRKLVPINGDVSLPGLGISAADRETLTSQVSVVFHSAARVRFDDDLKAAIDCNVKGPKRMAELCRDMKQLKAFVHVSTAFNNLHKSKIDEEIYPTSVDPIKLVELVDTMDKEFLAGLVKPLIGNCPNVYAYTKALGEQLLLNEFHTHDLPLVVIRPSIITPALKEPLPGWTDNMNGPTGIALGGGRGLLRCYRADPNAVGDLIPVDYVVNMMISAAWRRVTDETKQVKVYNCASGTLNPITWGEFRNHVQDSWQNNPTKDMMWYPHGTCYSSRFVFLIMIALQHYLPAIFLDLVLRVQGKKPFLVKLYGRVHGAMGALEFYTMRQWDFVTKNLVSLTGAMSEQDRQTFYFDVRHINWRDYLEALVIGTRVFLLKDNIETLPVARRNLKKMYYLRVAFRFALVFVLAALVYFGAFHQRSTDADSIIVTHHHHQQEATTASMSMAIPSIIHQQHNKVPVVDASDVLGPTFDFERKELIGISGGPAGQFA